MIVNAALEAIDASSLTHSIYRSGEPVVNVVTAPTLRIPDSLQAHNPQVNLRPILMLFSAFLCNLIITPFSRPWQFL